MKPTRRSVLAVGLSLGFTVAGTHAGPFRNSNRKAAPPSLAVPLISPSQVPTALPVNEPRPLVWVVDGAGDLRGCSNALTQANLLAGSPMELSVYPWSHGYRRLVRDQIDASHAKVQGARLAQTLQQRQRSEPGRRVVLVAHSAGCAVALAAGDSLPPDSLDRVILLAPSVSTGYDLRPTLHAGREGVDVFCSKKDWVALGFVVRVIGTTDKLWAPAAGRHGFVVRCADPVAERLRQHFWTPELAWTGHTGGHHGTHSTAFIHAYLFPLIGVQVRN